MQEEADRLRRQCDAEVAAVIHELKLAQAELAHLHSAAYSPERKATNREKVSQNLGQNWKPARETPLVPCGLMKPDDCEGCGAVTASDVGECYAQSGEHFDVGPVRYSSVAELCQSASDDESSAIGFFGRIQDLSESRIAQDESNSSNCCLSNEKESPILFTLSPQTIQFDSSFSSRRASDWFELPSRVATPVVLPPQDR